MDVCKILALAALLAAGGCDKELAGKYRGVGNVQYDILSRGMKPPIDPPFEDVEIKRDGDEYRVSFGGPDRACSFTVAPPVNATIPAWQVHPGTVCKTKAGEAKIASGTFTLDGSGAAFTVRGENTDGTFNVSWNFTGKMR